MAEVNLIELFLLLSMFMFGFGIGYTIRNNNQ